LRSKGQRSRSLGMEM